MIVEIAIDGGLQVDDGVKASAPDAFSRQGEKKVSTALSHDPDVGVKWNLQRGWRTSHRLTLGCLWVA
jgi:hypothetical protein